MNKREVRLSVVPCLLVASFFVAAVASASRGICLDSSLSNDDWVKKHLASSAFVILAEVVDFREVSWPRRPTSNEVGGMRELLELIEEGQKEQFFSYEAILLVDRVWKGPGESRLKVYYNAIPGNYGFKLPVGERFLVFGHDLGDGRYSISTVCGQTSPAKLAIDKINALDDLATQERLVLVE